MDVTVDLKGLDSLLKTMEGVKYETQRKGFRFALRKAAQQVRDQARANARRVDDPSTPASIPANIVERWSNSYNKKTGDLMFRVGILGGAKAPATAVSKSGKEKQTGSDVYYWRFLEFGTQKMAAKPFMRPAIQQSAAKVLSTFSLEADRAIQRAIAKEKKG